MTQVSDNPVIVPDLEQEHEKADDSSGPRIRCPLCGWSPRKETAGLAPAATSGIRSIREECVQRAFISGLRPSASRAVGGRRIRIGMRSDRTPVPLR